MRPDSARPGFALVLALLAILLITAGIFAGLSRLEVDTQVADAGRAATKAYALAQAGIERFLVRRDSLEGRATSLAPTAAPESVRVVLPGGYADVTLRRIQAAGGGLFLVRAHAVAAAGPLVGAQRTVAELMTWQPGSMHVESAWTSLSGLSKSGAAGTISGTDDCGQAPAVAGVAVAPPGYSQSGGKPVPSGSPPILAYPTLDSAGSAVHIDWNAIVNGNALSPDFVVPAVPFPSSSWFAANPASYPVILVQGDLSLPSSGRGLLVVTGSLSVGGGDSWNGIILVGDELESSGNTTVTGAVVTGLNVLLGQVVENSSVGSGTKTFQYSSCEVANATARLATLRPVPGTWMDNLPGY